MVPKIIKAAAGPHHLDPGDRDNEEPPIGDWHGSPMLSDDDGGYERSSFTDADHDCDALFHNITDVRSVFLCLLFPVLIDHI